MGRSPAFQCYAKDLYTGTSELSAAEFGSYWRGICWSWDNGPLPINKTRRRRALLLDVRDFDRIWPRIRSLWKRTAKGFVNARLEQIRKEQDEYREKQAEKARKRHSRGNAVAEPRDDSGTPPAGSRHVPEACPAPAPAPLDQKDQDHRAIARPVRAPETNDKVLLRLAHEALEKAPYDTRAELKDLAAKHGIDYSDPDVLTSVLNQAEHQRTLRAVES